MAQDQVSQKLTRRSVLALLGTGIAGSALAQHPLSSRTLQGHSFPGSLSGDMKDGSSKFTLDSTHRVKYSSGGSSFVEFLHQGHWVGRGLATGSTASPQNAFTIVAKDRPSSEQGILLDGDWRWVAASYMPHAGSSHLAVVKLSNARLPLSLQVNTLLDGTPIFTRWLTMTNESTKPIALMELSPWSGRLWSGNPSVSMGVSGRWEYTWEGWFHWERMEQGANLVQEERGLAWDDPYFILHNPTAGEYAFGQLAWPANYSMDFTKDDGISFRVGPSAKDALRVIAAGESITTPALHLGCVKGNFDTAVQSMHDHIRRSVRPPADPSMLYRTQYLIPEDWSMTVYRGDQYNEANMKKCIDVAAAVGIESFILDGPMWCSAYGNWSVPNKKRFPNGLKPLAEYAHGKGLLFGLYSETEGGRDGYCSKPDGACIGAWAETAVFREHPDWFIQPRSVLNLAIPEAARYMNESVTQIVEQYELDLFRHDFNAPQRGHGSHTERDGFIEENYWRHYDAFYDIFRDVRKKYPKVILQQAAAGGARSDLATASVFQEQFTSDRATMPFVYRMLSGLSIFLPPEAWVNANGLAMSKDLPDLDTTLRGAFALGNTPMIFNAVLPKSVEDLTPEVKERYLHYATLYKEFIRPLLPDCKVYHHAPVNATGGVESGDWFAMEFVSPDRSRGWATIIRLSERTTEPYVFRPNGLDSNRRYRVTIDSSGAQRVQAAKEIVEYGDSIEHGTASELLLFQLA